MNSKASCLVGKGGERVALTDVDVSASLLDSLAEVTINQCYVNRENKNIEAVYTFPLPLDAVLVEMLITIGDRTLKGIVIEKAEAQESYENALADGDAAIMLEEIEPGLYTINVGNLLPEEKVSIALKYSILYRWYGDQLRFFLPTTVAPRYGRGTHLPHQVPEASLTVENQFSLSVVIHGSLNMAQFVCPSHNVNLIKNNEGVVISLRETKAAMDRDFVLNIRAPDSQKSVVVCGKDVAGFAAIASFQPFFPGLKQSRSLNLVIVVDCSGSMKGDSIKQVKQALGSIVDVLQSKDRISLIAFGSETRLISNELLPCDPENIQKAKSFVDEIDANMGGTNIDKALRDTYSVLKHYESADVLLITDGAVANWQLVVAEAKKSGHRIFTVGVGNAVAEAFVRELASSTGGECELVAPCEGMAEKVVRHFERIRAPKAKRAAIHWPKSAKAVTPVVLGAVFEGGTVIASAQLKSNKKLGVVTLEVETENGETFSQELEIEPPKENLGADGISAVAKLAASFRLKDLTQNKKQCLETALKYQLISPWTNYLVISERQDSEKVFDLPALRKVPQTLAAGWGGVGSVDSLVRYNRLILPSKSLETCFSVNAPQYAATESVGLRKAPANFRKFIDLINDKPERLQSSGLHKLLEESSLLHKLEDVFKFSNSIGLEEEFTAFVIVQEILHLVDQYLSDRASFLSKKYIDQRRRILKFLEELSERASNYGELLKEPLLSTIFDANKIRETLDAVGRLAASHELLHRSEMAIKKLMI